MGVRINWDEVDEVEDFSPVPAGEYLIAVAEIEEKETTGGDPLWRLKLTIIDGPFTGRNIWDNMVFSAAAIKRAKLICSRLGLNTSTEMDLETEMLIGRKCRIAAEVEEREVTDDDGNAKMRKFNVIPFAGYYKLEDEDRESTKKPAANPTAKTTGKAKANAKPKKELPF